MVMGSQTRVRPAKWKKRNQFDAWLPLIAVSMMLAIGWFVTLRFRQTVRDSVSGAYQATQLELVRAVARSAVRFIEDESAKGQSKTEIEQGIFKRYVAPVKLLDNGDAWIYAPDHVVFDLSADFPEEYKGRSMAEIFAIQRAYGASHYEAMTADVTEAREGVGWYIWLPEKGQEIAAWTPVRVGEQVWTIGLSTPLSEILHYTGAAQQDQLLTTVMALATVIGISMALYLTRVQTQRQEAESLLEEANKTLSQRVQERTTELAERTKEVVELQYREQLKAKEAEIAYNAGLFESASSYLHNIGNSLTALDGKLFTVRKVLAAADEYGAAIDQIRAAHEQAKREPNTLDKTGTYLQRLDDVLVKHTLPMLRENVTHIGEIKEQMVQAIRHQQETFLHSRQRGQKYIQEIKLAEVVEQVLFDFKPTLQKRGITIITDLDRTLTVQNQKGPLIYGLTNLLKNAIEAIEAAHHTPTTPNVDSSGGEIRISLRNIGTSELPRAEVRMCDNGVGIAAESFSHLFSVGYTTKPHGHGLGLHSFSTFLAENNGSIRAARRTGDGGAEFIVEIGNV
jgi:signal transduction histidine kinase